MSSRVNWVLAVAVCLMAGCDGGNGAGVAPASESSGLGPSSGQQKGFGPESVTLCDVVRWASVAVIGTLEPPTKLEDTPHLKYAVVPKVVLKGKEFMEQTNYVVSYGDDGAPTYHDPVFEVGATYFVLFKGDHATHHFMDINGHHVRIAKDGTVLDAEAAKVPATEKELIAEVEAIVADPGGKCGPLTPFFKDLIEE
ncbi:MAG: hypothetical protein AMXMBFR64_61900 [Myxococcales bacterium]